MDTQTKLDNVNCEFVSQGRKLFRVTEVLVSAGLINTDFFTEEGKIRGTAVHLASDYLIRGNLDWETVHPKCLGYVKAAQKFLDSKIFIPILDLCDVRDQHEEYFYTGKPDWFGLVNGYHSIVEIKTGESSTANLQTAAYAEMPKFKKFKPKRFLLQLKENGKFKFEEYKNPNDFALFVKYLRECEKVLT